MESYDAVIVGGGAAGLSAALVLGRARRRVIVIDAGEPRNAPAAHMHGYLTRDGQPPADFLALGRAEAAGYGVEFRNERVAAIEPGFAVRLSGGGTVSGRQVLVATGIRDTLANIEGLQEYWGSSAVHCPYCHGYEVRDQELAVVATNAHAVEYALLVRQWSANITLCGNGQEIAPKDRDRLAARGVAVADGQVVRVNSAAGQLAGVELDDGTVVPCQAVFAQSVMTAQSQLLAGLGCEIGDLDVAITDGQGRTSVAGVWAAGNVADAMASVIHAAAAGVAAAMQLNVELVRADTSAALAAR